MADVTEDQKRNHETATELEDVEASHDLKARTRRVTEDEIPLEQRRAEARIM